MSAFIEYKMANGETCDVHMLAGRKATWVLFIRSRPVAHVCNECLRDLTMISRDTLTVKQEDI